MLNFNEQDYYANIPILEKHALNNSNNRELKDCLVLVHPYFCELEGEYMSKIPEFKGYKNRLEKIFKKSEKISLVLYEEATHYSKFTYKIVEKNIFDKVMFTKGSFGELHNKKNLNYFENKNIFIGGMYNGLCLSSAISEINQKLKIKKITSIREISLNNWFKMREQSSVFPKKIINFNNEVIDIINFEKFYNKFFK
jgi:hypothetical protein